MAWPKPPANPRIKLLRVFSGGRDFADNKTQKGRIFHWLTGDMAESLPLASPYGVTADGDGRIWVTDPGLKAVHFFNLKKRRAEIWPLAGTSPFLSPSGIYFNPSQQLLYIADSAANRVVVLSAEGQFLRELIPSKPFKRPAGLAMDSQGVLYVAEVLSGLIRRFSTEGDELEPIGSPLEGGRFHRPIGLTIDAEDRVYVIDSLNFQIVVLSAAGEHIVTIGQLGDQPGTFSRPRGVAVDTFGHIYVTDAAFDNIQIFNLEGELLLVFGQGGKFGLSLPAGLFVDKSDRIYAVDSFSHRIQIYQFLGNSN